MSSSAGSIVVGVDGSEASRHALEWATHQAAGEHRPLTLVSTISAVTPAWMDQAAENPREARIQLVSEGHALLAAARADVGGWAPDVEVHEHFELADAREVLLQLSPDAEMVVVGSRGRGPVRSLLLGSVGTALVRRAACPVVVHRPGKRGSVKHGVVVGADALPESAAVLEFAYRQASLHRLPLTVLHCALTNAGLAGPAYISSEPHVEIDDERRVLAEAMAGMGEKYPEVPVQVEVVRARPQEVLVRLGERMDLVVVGGHQRPLGGRLLLGSVSLAVVEHAACPVAVVPVHAD